MNRYKGSLNENEQNVDVNRNGVNMNESSININDKKTVNVNEIILLQINNRTLPSPIFYVFAKNGGCIAAFNHRCTVPKYAT